MQKQVILLRTPNTQQPFMCKLKTTVLLIAACALGSILTNAQEIKGVTTEGSAGVTVSVGELQQISDNTPKPKKLRRTEEFEIRRKLRNAPGSPPVASFPNNGVSTFDVATTQALHSNFQAITLGESSSVPPDCMGDVSETQVCIAANGRIKFYAKPSVCDAPLTTSTAGSTTSLTGAQFNIGLDPFFSSVRNNSSTTDPQVHYDRLSGRWFISCINTVDKSNRILLAVSNSSTITAASSFTFYYFEHDRGTVSGGFDYQRFGDFPMMGIDKFAVYIGVLVFNATSQTYEGSSCFVIKKSSVLSGGPLSFTAFRRIGTSSAGIYAPNPAYNDDPQATKGYFVGANAANYGVLSYVIVNDPGGTPTSTTGQITVPITAAPITQPAKGSKQPIDAGDDRLLGVQIMKNKLTGSSSIWTAQNLGVTQAGVGSENATRNAMRWYELNITATALTLKQSGTWFDNAASNPVSYIMGSIAASGQGHAFAGATAAGTAFNANVALAGRYNGQTNGELTSTVFATTSTASYNVENGSEQRWGDYSQTVVDPSDNMTLWTFQEYTNADNSWGERAIQAKAPPPATPTSLSPIVCNAAKTAEVVLTGSSSNYSGFFDPGADTDGPGFTKRLRITSTGNVTISGIKLESATQIRFTINFSAAPAGSQQTLTITNPDCQSVTYAYTLPATCDGTQVTKPVNVTPNPASGTINVLLQNTGGEIKLLDAEGRLVYREIATSNYIIIPATGFAKGVYFVQYINGENTTTEKLVLL